MTILILRKPLPILAPSMVRARSKRAAENDIKLQAAMNRLADSTYSTIYSAAKHLSLSHKTLGRRVARGKSYAQAREDA